MKKLINDESEKKAAVLLVTGIVAVAKLIGGAQVFHPDADKPDSFLDSCEDIAELYVERLMDVEKDME